MLQEILRYFKTLLIDLLLVTSRLGEGVFSVKPLKNALQFSLKTLPITMDYSNSVLFSLSKRSIVTRLLKIKIGCQYHPFPCVPAPK